MRPIFSTKPAVRAPRPQTRTLPMIAPIKGWVRNENIAQIPKDGAFVLENWIPETNQISIRPGHKEHSDPGNAAVINSLMVFDAGGSKQLFAGEQTSIWDVTTSSPAEDVTGLSNTTFSHTMFTTSSGNYLYLVNGADSFRTYDGTTWAAQTVTGITMADYDFVFSFANRLFFLKENSATAAFLPVDSIAGAATTFEFGGELALGGTLVAGAALTHDAGDGPEDYFVVISSEGEVLVYQGTDPSTSDLWRKKGRFRIGRPIGSRCLLQIGGDLAVLTQDGVVSLARSILLDRAAAPRGAFSDRIRKAFADQYALSSSLIGWEIETWPFKHIAICNVPIVANTTFRQYVMNVLTGAWARWTGVNATTWALMGDDLYFGGTDGKVYQFGTVGADNGSAVTAVCVGAFFDFGDPGRIKHVKGALAYAKTDGQVTIGVNMTSDYTVVEQAASTAAFGEADGAVFDTDTWDNATWVGAGDVVDSAWLGIAAEGRLLAPVIVAQVDGSETTNTVQVDFLSMNILYEKGAVIG